MLIARVKDVREDNDLSQRELALVFGVSRSAYGRWESFPGLMPAYRLNDICNYFNVSMDYIMGLTRRKDTTISNFKLNKELIGKRLRTFRKRIGFSQAELASIVKTGHSTISGYETGKNILLLSFALDIAYKYNVSLDYLYGRSNEMYIKSSKN